MSLVTFDDALPRYRNYLPIKRQYRRAVGRGLVALVAIESAVPMADVVHEFASPVRGRDNREYKVRAFAEQRGNIWVGWLEFAGPLGERPRRTGEETSQPKREAVAYWATGLEPIYLEGALERAR